MHVGVVERLRDGGSAWSRLVFEQNSVPRAAARLGLELVIYPHAAAPLRSQLPALALNFPYQSAPRSGILEKLASAVAAAGARGAAGLIEIGEDREVEGFTLPPYVGHGFRPLPGEGKGAELDLPPEFVLCPGVSSESIPLLLASWSWVEGSLGDSYPLVVANGQPALDRMLLARARELDLQDSVRVLGQVGLSSTPRLFQSAAAMLCPQRLPWGQPLRWALATGLPIATVQSEGVESIVGDAAYVVPPGDARALGAACLTLLVEPEMARGLKDRGLIRATAFHQHAPADAFNRAMGNVLRRNGSEA